MGRVKCRGRGLSWRKYHPALCLNNLFSSNGFFLYITCLITCRICHVLAVRRLRWRRKRDSDDSSCLQLASCGLDHSVRIFNVAVLAWLAVLLSRNTTLKLLSPILAYIQCTPYSLNHTAPAMWRPSRGRCGFCWWKRFLRVHVTNCLLVFAGWQHNLFNINRAENRLQRLSIRLRIQICDVFHWNKAIQF